MTNVIGVTGFRGRLGRELVALGAEPFDPMNQLFGDSLPTTLIHAAAFTDVDGCEKDAHKAINDNVMLTDYILRALRPTDRIIFISTDFIFDGESGPYADYEQYYAPLNVYGTTKLLGEKLVQQANAQWNIVRTTGLFGLYPDRPTFLDWTLQKLEAGDLFEVDGWRTTTMTDVRELARVIWGMANEDYDEFNRLINVTSGEVGSKFDFACAVAKVWGYEPGKIFENLIDTGARRPRYGGLTIDLLKELGYTMKSTEQSLREWKEIWDLTHPA